MSANPNADIPDIDNDGVTEPGERYGYAFDIQQNGDIKLNRLGDPEKQYDADAVEQDLKVALLTPEGDDPFRPEYGFDIFRAIATSDAQFRSAIVECIGPDADPRVDQINSVEIDRVPDGDRENTQVTVNLTLVEGEVIEFHFEPETDLSSIRGLGGVL